MKEKKSLKIIIAIIVILLIIAIGFGIFILNKGDRFENDWEEEYYNTLLSDSREHEITYTIDNGETKTEINDYYNNAKNTKIKFIQVKEDTTPVMVVSYNKENKNKLFIYSKDTQNQVCIDRCPTVDADGNEFEKNNNYSVEFLYNIEEQKYEWYIKETNENNKVTFSSIILHGDEEIKNAYNFTEEEMKTNQVAEDETPILSKFEETFIVIDNGETDFIEIGDIHNINEKDLKKSMKEVAQNYKDNDEIITEEIKTATETKLEEIKQKQEQIKVAEEEKAKKEAEEKAKAEEEARIKAEEEAKKKEEEAKQELKVGNYTLKYGKYTGKNFTEGTDHLVPDGTATYTINADGTYIFTTSKGENKSGTYKVEMIGGGVYGIAFSDGTRLGVTSNNSFHALAGADVSFTYTGN